MHASAVSGAGTLTADAAEAARAQATEQGGAASAGGRVAAAPAARAGATKAGSARAPHPAESAKPPAASQTKGTGVRRPAGGAARTRVTPSRVKLPSGGYAKPAASASKSASAPSTSAKTSGMSLEDKLFAYLKQYAATVEKELDEQITRAKAAEAKKSSGGGGIMGSLMGAVSGVPVLGEIASGMGQAATQKLLSSIGGALLGGVASVIGTPVLGAIVSQIGPSIVDSVLGSKLPGGSTASSAATSKTDTAESEQIRAMEIQRLVTKLNEAMTAVSNVLKSEHEMRMTAIQNIR